MANLGAAAKPPEMPGLAGDLDLFGLPGLLQTLAQSQLTGVLTLMNTATLASDGLSLKPTGVPGTPLPDEDPDFVHLVWKQVEKGATPLACEAAIATDGYRTRRLLAHWLEEGSLAAA